MPTGGQYRQGDLHPMFQARYRISLPIPRFRAAVRHRSGLIDGSGLGPVLALPLVFFLNLLKCS